MNLQTQAEQVSRDFSIELELKLIGMPDADKAVIAAAVTLRLAEDALNFAVKAGKPSEPTKSSVMRDAANAKGIPTLEIKAQPVNLMELFGIPRPK